MKFSRVAVQSGKALCVCAVAFSFSATALADTVTAEQAKQRQVISCATGAAVGSVLGGLLGNKLSKDLGMDRSVATAAGATAGVFAGCAIAKQLTAADTQQIQEAEAAAAKDGSSTKSWKSADGQTVTVQSKAEPVVIADKPNAVCKSVQSTTKVARGQPAVSKDVYCADVGGDYKQAGLVL